MNLGEWREPCALIVAHCVEDAAEHGVEYVLLPESPVVPDEPFPILVERTTWADIDGLGRRLGAMGIATTASP